MEEGLQDDIINNNWNTYHSLASPLKRAHTINISKYRHVVMRRKGSMQRTVSERGSGSGSMSGSISVSLSGSEGSGESSASERIASGSGISSWRCASEDSGGSERIVVATFIPGECSMARLAELAKDYGKFTLDIPSTEQVVGSGKPYTIYVIKIITPELKHWEKKYRYSQLLALHKHLSKFYPSLIDKPFPEKTYTTKKSSSEVIDWRKFLLQKYLRQVINNEMLCNDDVVKEYLFNNDK